MTLEIDLTGRTSDVNGYRALATEMCAAVADEPGTIRYDWHVSADGATRNVDVYEDGPAFLEHFGSAQANGLLPRFIDLVDIERVDVVGDVSEEAREVLVGFGANFLDEVETVSK